jgi:hypothetical protein
MTQQQTPANWYPDPSDAAQWRYWDGASWTDNVAPREVVSNTPDEDVAMSAAPTQSRSERRMSETTFVPPDQIPSGSNRNRIIAVAAALGLLTLGAIAFWFNGSGNEPSASAPPVDTATVVGQITVPVVFKLQPGNEGTPTFPTPSSSVANSSTLVMSSSYTSQSPLDVGGLALDATATVYSSSATLKLLSIADTRTANGPYTVRATASDFTKVGVDAPSSNEIVNAQNIGLTDIKLVTTTVAPKTFISKQTSDAAVSNTNLVGYENPAAFHVAGNATGSSGLGSIPHPVLHASSGLGTTEISGLVSVAAPPNTLDGLYAGTITFTIVEE